MPAPGSLYNPIPVASTTPTPVKKVKKVAGKSSAVPKDVPMDSKNTKRKAYDGKTKAEAGPSSAVTRIKSTKNKKRARTEPLPEEKQASVPSYVGKVVIVPDSD